MDVNDALAALAGADPAATLTPLEAGERAARGQAILASGPVTMRHRQRSARRRALQVVVAAAATLVIGVGVAWAAGALTPLAVFQGSIQQQGVAPGTLFDQRIVPDTVHRFGAVDLPRIGKVSLWTGLAAQGGWCAALRLPDGHWLGTPGDEGLDRGGTAPGCYPTRSQTNATGGTAVLIIDGFDYQESDVAARSHGNSMWRIRFGRITVGHTVRVKDVVSGRSAPVRNGWFMLAVLDPDAMDADNGVHLVALDRAGHVVGDDCPNCGG